VIANDATCWHTLDPHTRLLTSDSPNELIERGVFAPEEAPKAGELIVRSEYLVEDVNTFAGLATRRVPVGILDHATRGDPQRSARYRDLLLPSGIPHELRAAFVIRGRVWGRGPHRPPLVDRSLRAAGRRRARRRRRCNCPWHPRLAALRRRTPRDGGRGAGARGARPTG
jgi:hypothetical protein